MGLVGKEVPELIALRCHSSHHVNCAPQTEWSAFRSAEYGSGLLEIVDSETATWSWNGFFKQACLPFVQF